jgi:hypothetical protein
MKIAYDTKLKRPACVLIQAGMGCGTGVANRFPPETWLVHPTDNMGVFEATEEQMEQLVKITVAHNKKLIDNRAKLVKGKKK